jgi:hypothetical protein
MDFGTIKKSITWRNGLFAAAVTLLAVAAKNGMSASSYSGAPGADPNAEIQAWLMTALPVVGSAILGFVGKMLKLDPEHVAAMKNFASNPTVAEFEKRAVNAAIEFLLPRLGKYPELLLAVLKAVAPSFSKDPEVVASIGKLGQDIAKNFLTNPAPAPQPQA